MRNIMAARVLVLLSMQVAMARGQTTQYPPLSEYMMPPDAEVALAKSAAPQNISDHATIRVLTISGYKVVHQGGNGFVCMVMRGFTGAPTFAPAQPRMFINYDPKTRAPICFDPNAVKTVLPYYDLRTTLGLEGKTPDQITEAVKTAYDQGTIPKRAGVSFAYMWSADQILGPSGHWHPHMMVFAPNYENSMLGNNDLASYFPTVGDDAGTPFAVLVIPVDEKLFVKAQP
jgi:hypothetical protein